jgi:hypothetical protein
VPLEHRRPGLGNMDPPHMRVHSPLTVVAALVVGHIHSHQRLEIVSRHGWGNVLVMPVPGGLHPFQQGS